MREPKEEEDCRFNKVEEAVVVVGGRVRRVERHKPLVASDKPRIAAAASSPPQLRWKTSGRLSGEVLRARAAGSGESTRKCSTRCIAVAFIAGYKACACQYPKARAYNSCELLVGRRAALAPPLRVRGHGIESGSGRVV